MLDFFVKTIDDKETSRSLGLPEDEALRRLGEDGENMLEQGKKKSSAKIFVNQFRDVMVMILLAATVISLAVGEIYDAATIILIVMLNAALGFIQEFRTEKTLEALEKMTAPNARVYRDGKLTVIPASRLVRGDVIELEAGDRVPADCFIVKANGFMCDEAILTGETHSAMKRARTNESSCDGLNLDFACYMGTTVSKGTALCQVAVTGKRTQMGKVSGMLAEIEEELTPLQKRLGELGKILAVICVAVCVLVFIVGILHGEPAFAMLMTGITIAIAAIPEGLPATVTIALALAVRRMLKRKAFVHKLHSVETLGCASVICSDKTGTITENKMTVTKILTADSQFTVTGQGNKAEGKIIPDAAGLQNLSALHELLICSVVCNNGLISASYTGSGGRNRTNNSQWLVSGDPTETALLIAAAKGGVTREELGAVKIDEVPFESETRQMSVTARLGENQFTFIKGASDAVLKQCGYVQLETTVVKLDGNMKKLLEKQSEQLAAQALRVIAFAENIGGRTIFLGFCGMIDPPRPEAKQAVKLCAKAHIKTVMITGDHKLTAVEIARQAGIFHSGDRAITGDELQRLSDEALDEIIESVSVFARVTPADKLRIVRAFKRRGHIVAMTGDGVNDAPAVKEADIGVAMGISGTDVTKQAGDVILLDDNFATLVSAVEQGRTIYSNIRKFVRYLISCNIGEIITMLFGILMGLPMVLLPTQILLVNLVTDGLSAVALSLEPTEESIMKRRPRSRDESFFSGGLLSRIVFRGLLIGLCTLGCFVTLLRLTGSVDTARTGAFFTLVMSQLIHVFECKSEDKNFFTVSHFSNPFMILAVAMSLLCLLAAIYLPPLQIIFSTVVLSSPQLAVALGFSFVIPVISAIVTKI